MTDLTGLPARQMFGPPRPSALPRSPERTTPRQPLGRRRMVGITLLS